MGCPVTLSYCAVIIEKESTKLVAKIFHGGNGFNVDNFAAVVPMATTAASFPDTNNFGFVFKKLVCFQEYSASKKFIKCIQSKDQ